ncbi:MAG: hypothetical protein ACHQD8_02115 [Chitinophagales bacterium]
MSLIYTGHFSWFGLFVLLIFSLPLIINKNQFLFLFGAVSMFVWAYLLITVICFQAKYLQGHINYYSGSRTLWNFIVGYIFTGTSIIFSLLLAGKGLRS